MHPDEKSDGVHSNKCEKIKKFAVCMKNIQLRDNKEY
jgi:hypothetical protein